MRSSPEVDDPAQSLANLAAACARVAAPAATAAPTKWDGELVGRVVPDLEAPIVTRGRLAAPSSDVRPAGVRAARARVLRELHARGWPPPPRSGRRGAGEAAGCAT